MVLEWILSGQNLLEQSGLPTTQQLVEKIEDFILFYTHDLDKTMKIAEVLLIKGLQKGVELIFAPRQLLRQILLIMTLQTVILGSQYISNSFSSFATSRSKV